MSFGALSARLEHNRILFEGAPTNRKEWLHFTIHHPEIALVVNVGAFERDGDRTFAKTVLAFAGDEVAGSVRAVEPTEVSMPAGTDRAQMGSLSWSGGSRNTLFVDDPELELELRLRLEPRMAPSLLPPRRLANGGALHWLVTPSLAAHGTIRFGERALVCRGVPAYRDRNWGRFDFKSGTSWDWGYAVSTTQGEPFVLVFGTLYDLAGRPHDTACLVWHDGQLVGIHRRRVALDWHGAPRTVRVTAPPAWALAFGNEEADVPGEGTITIRSPRADLTVRLRLGSIARLAIPSDGGSGWFAIHESPFECRAEGTLEGRAVRFGGIGFCERAYPVRGALSRDEPTLRIEDRARGASRLFSLLADTLDSVRADAPRCLGPLQRALTDSPVTLVVGRETIRLTTTASEIVVEAAPRGTARGTHLSLEPSTLLDLVRGRTPLLRALDRGALIVRVAAPEAGRLFDALTRLAEGCARSRRASELLSRLEHFVQEGTS